MAIELVAPPSVEQSPAPNAVNLSEADLEKLTNETMGDVLGGPQARQNSSSDAGQSSEGEDTQGTAAENNTTLPPQKSQVALSDDEKTLLTELRALQEMSGTPYKSPADLVKGYKELHSTWTKEHEFVNRVKPHEQLVNDMLTDPNFAQFIQEATTMFRNPQLAASYSSAAHGQVDAPPDPRNFDMYDPDQKLDYDKAQADYINRQLDSRINARFGQSEAKLRLENEKAQLKTLFPDTDPDDIVKRITERSKKGWNLVDGYKVLEFDNIEAKAREKARVELTSKFENAQRTGSPLSAGGSQQQVQLGDILDHITKHGSDSARKKFGDKNLERAISDSAAMQLA